MFAFLSLGGLYAPNASTLKMTYCGSLTLDNGVVNALGAKIQVDMQKVLRDLAIESPSCFMCSVITCILPSRGSTQI